jgi:hypothetical protein
MKIATGQSTTDETTAATREAYEDLLVGLGQTPQVLVVHTSAQHSLDEIAATLAELAPNVPTHLGTSSRGVMTNRGHVRGASGVGLGMWGACDDMASFGVAGCELGDDPQDAARSAVRSAVRAAGRHGESPDLIWLTAAPGREEKILAGIAEVVGAGVPVVGGSSADDEVLGTWRQGTHEERFGDGVVLTVMYVGGDVGVSFHSGYFPTEHRGRVTRADDRTLFEIDGRPARDIYNEWTEGLLREVAGGEGNVLALTTMTPLGRVGPEDSVRALLHPEHLAADGSLRLFANIAEGEELVLMRGTADGLATRAERVVNSARAGLRDNGSVVGGLVIYCAGCMMAIESEMGEVARGIDAAIDGTPFLGVFTFGEQGCVVEAGNLHGNLMISSVVFAHEDAR